MTNPSTSLATLRPDLGGSFMEIDLEMAARGLIAMLVFPVIQVMKQSGIFGRIPLEQLLQIHETLRGPGAGYSRSNFTFTSQPFVCEEHGHEEMVDDRSSKMYVDFFSAEAVHAARALNIVLTNAEIRTAAQVFDPVAWTGAPLFTVVPVAWPTVTSKIITDVSNAKIKVWQSSGLHANALIINWITFEKMLLNDQIIDRLKFSGHVDPNKGNITEMAMAQAVGIDKLIVAGAPKNTANAAQPAVISHIWVDGNAMVCRVAETNDVQEPCIGRTFHWPEDGSSERGTFESYRDETRRSDVVRVRHDVDEVRLYVEAGHLLDITGP